MRLAQEVAGRRVMRRLAPARRGRRARAAAHRPEHDRALEETREQVDAPLRRPQLELRVGPPASSRDEETASRQHRRRAP